MKRQRPRRSAWDPRPFPCAEASPLAPGRARSHHGDRCIGPNSHDWSRWLVPAPVLKTGGSMPRKALRSVRFRRQSCTDAVIDKHGPLHESRIYLAGGSAESSHCWESPRAFSVNSTYKLALSIHPGARIASAGILAIQIKCFNAFLPDSVEARGEAGIEGIRLTPGREAICSASEQIWRTIFATFSRTASALNEIVTLDVVKLSR